MRVFTFQYPGDEPEGAASMNRREFLSWFPRHPILVVSVTPDGTYYEDEVPVPPDLVVCDCCNEDPGDDITVVEGSRVYCRKCADEYITPYRLKADDRVRKAAQGGTLRDLEEQMDQDDQNYAEQLYDKRGRGP